MNKVVILSISVLFVSLLIIISCKGKERNATSELKEVSTELDVRNLKPFLNKITPLIDSGFTHAEIDKIFDQFQDLKMDAENDYNYKIRYNGNDSIMKLKMVKEDADIIRLYIYAAPNLSDKINAALFKLMEEKGL